MIRNSRGHSSDVVLDTNRLQRGRGRGRGRSFPVRKPELTEASFRGTVENDEFRATDENQQESRNADVRPDIWYLAEILSGMIGSSSTRVKAKADVIRNSEI